jgi:effector-binding domain-containing protein
MEGRMKSGFQVQIRYLLLPLLIALIVFVGYLLSYLGYFNPVTIGEGTAGPFHLLYKEHTGAYHKIVPTIEEVEHWAQAHHIDCTKSFGYYLDNPDVVEEGRLRSWGGCLLANPQQDSLSSLPDGFKEQDLPEQKYVTAVFAGSPAIGPQKVYPAVREYMEKRRLNPKGPVLEQYVIHSQTSMTTTYYFPLQ